jgi:hypothetical protein
MRRWLAGVTASLALVAFWALPPAQLEAPRLRGGQERLRAQTVAREIGRANAALRALRWADTLPALAVRTAVDGVAIGLPRAPGLDADELRAWVGRQQEALTEIEPRDPEMVVGLIWRPADLGAIPGMPIAARTRAVTFVGRHRGTPFCVRALPYLERAGPATLRYGPDLGPCRIYAKYGAPGDMIQEWLEAASLGFARVAAPTYAADIARMQPPARGTMRLFGMTRPPQASANVAVQACLAGRADACERALTDPELIAPQVGDEAWIVANSPASSLGGGAATPPFGYLDDGLLYEWEATFGTEAFRRFWTSTRPVPDAFETAFGEPLGEWVLGWAEHHVGLYRAGPSIPSGALGWCLLTLSALAAVATATAARRRAP